MNKTKLLVILILTMVFMSSCSISSPTDAGMISHAPITPASSSPAESNETESPSVTTEAEESYDLTLHIPAPALENNMLGEKNSKQVVYLKLPSSYYDSDKSYPVVYFLDGYSSSFYHILDCTSLQETNADIILVGISGTNKLGGGFYVDSPVSGNWESFIIDDVVNYIDNNYRTIPQSDSRGLLGFSMGGSGVLNIGLNHPDMFSVVYAVCPGVFDENGLIKAFNSGWSNTFKAAYGAAFSPNVSLDFPYADIPKFDGSNVDNKIVDNWEKGFGDWENKIAEYLKLQNKLSLIRIDYGESDHYTWIPDGCIFLSELLTENNIDNELVPFDGGHDVTGRMQTEVISFFSNQFDLE